MTCGVILSGGLSRRFQVPGEPWVDKALYPISGTPMIKIIYDKLVDIVDRIIVALGSPGRVNAYKGVLGEFTYVVDDDRLSGPLAGIYQAVRVCDSDRVLVVPVDMPFISRDLLVELTKLSKVYDVVSPILPNGLIETTLTAFNRSVVLWILELLREHGRSRIADIHRGAPRVHLVNVKERGYKPLEFVNINRREELNVKHVDYPEGPLRADVTIARDFNRDDVISRDPRIRGSLWGTLYLGGYIEELLLYARSGAYMLVAYTLLDSPFEYERFLGELIIGALKTSFIST